MSRTVPVAIALLALLLAPRPAHAQLTVTWTAPAGCPTSESVQAEVIRLLGGALPEELALEADGVTTELEGRWTLRLRTSTDGNEGVRVVEGDACAPLGDAAALILALMIDPAAVAEHAPLGPIEPPADPPAPEPPPTHVVASQLADPRPEPPATPTELVTPPPPEPSRARRAEGAVSRVVEHGREEPRATAEEPPSTADESPPLQGFIGLGGAFDVGSVPDASGAITVEGGFGVPLVEARLRATFVFGREARRDARVGAQITTGMLDARACFHPFDEARFVYGCLGLGLGVTVAEGFGLSGPEVGVGTFGAAVGGLGVAWSPEPWFDLDLDATLIAPFNPLEFAVRGSPDDVFHVQEPVAGRFGLSIHVRF
ncbi:MAG: hypothetical protein H6719_28505 [Sandaracinaceae bacterium]|nr:hypothetical protein [Sandaracinaceae bacterium]